MNSIIIEFREFFLRHTQVNSGAKPDQETGYPLQYIITGVGSKFNRLLKGDYPSEGVFKKLCQSITFKLNVEDTATITAQGLTRIATDTEAETRTDNGSGTFENVVKPHQLPNIVLESDLNDTVIGNPVQLAGLKLSVLKRTISGVFWRNFLLELNPSKSIIIDATTKKVQLDGDITAPGNNYYYATNGSGVKGWLPIAGTIFPYRLLDVYISETGLTNTNGSSVITDMYSYILAATTITGAKQTVHMNSNLDYTIGSVYYSLYIGAVLVKTWQFNATNASKCDFTYELTYIGTNKALVTINLRVFNLTTATEEMYIDSVIVAFNPTIANTFIQRVTNGSANTIINIKKTLTTLKLI